ncbi:MAG: riboflavin synthase [Acidimicrobiia bacterium]|nr:riboflavin synthase [Acidimicrobiia bacterium]
MFTGIVEAVGEVRDARDADGRRRLVIAAPTVTEGMEVGDSIAVNGVCLTAVEVGEGSVAVEAVHETLQRSNLGEAGVGTRVDLERPMPAHGRFDGHVVQGHVDGTGVVRSTTEDGASRRYWFDTDGGLLRYLVEKGSVTVDGVSLTVSDLDDDGFEVVLIPHTLEVTVLGDRNPGDRVNLEVDVLAKYVERLLEART